MSGVLSYKASVRAHDLTHCTLHLLPLLSSFFSPFPASRRTSSILSLLILWRIGGCPSAEPNTLTDGEGCQPQRGCRMKCYPCAGTPSPPIPSADAARMAMASSVLGSFRPHTDDAYRLCDAFHVVSIPVDLYQLQVWAVVPLGDLPAHINVDNVVCVMYFNVTCSAWLSAHCSVP